MERTDLIERLRKEMGYSEEEASRVVDAMMESMTESLSQGDRITLPGIGTMAVVDRASRKSVDPETGEETDRPVRGIKFSPGKRLKDALMSLDFITKGLE
ncbi:DNA-binding protein HU [anaerobic digester metagenome]